MPLLHLAIAQFRPRKADVPGNLTRIGEVLAQAAALSPRPHVVHFPETATSAYFVEGGVRECSLTIAELTAGIAQAYAAASSAASADGVPIVMHDDSLKRTMGVDRLVAKTRRAELPAAVPIFEQAIACFAELGLGCNVEIKPCEGREAETGRATVEACIDRIWDQADIAVRKVVVDFYDSRLNATETRNAPLLMALEACDWGIAPTRWQKHVHPRAYHDRISVLFDGIDSMHRRSPKFSVATLTRCIRKPRQQLQFWPKLSTSQKMLNLEV